MANRWTKEEKLKLINMYSNGKTLDEIGKKLNRSSNAIKLRMENIIYDNILKGNTKDIIADELKISEDDVIQMYYSYKSFLEKRGDDTSKTKKIDLTRRSKGKGKGKGNENKKELQKLISDDNIKNLSVYKLKKIRDENKIMEDILKNYQMKRELEKLLKSNKLDSESIKLLKKIYSK
jgi:DNA-binding CsgD family transcriptional regulator